MKKLLLAVVFCASACACAFAYANQKAENAVETDAVSTRLCNFWQYEFDVFSYTCSSVGGYVNLVEVRDFNNAVGVLESRIRDLEKKVELLEAKLEETSP